MNIGYVKYGQSIHLDLGEVGTSSGGSRIRVRFLRALLKAGHEITLLSDVPKSHNEVLQEWLDRYPMTLHYKPESYRVGGFDLLLIECGPTNTMFGGAGGGVPNLVRCNKILAKYEGLVMYFEHDIDLGFVFTLESFGPTYFRRGHYAAAPSLSLTKNKTWVVLVQAFDTKRFLETCSTVRWPYKALKIPARVLPTPTLGIQEPLPVKLNPRWDLAYVGNPRSRLKLLQSYYSYPGDVVIYGNWGPKFAKQFPNATFPGRIPQGTTMRRLNNARCVVHIGGPKFIETKNIAPRFYEAICSGTVLLVDANFALLGPHDVPTGLRKYVPQIPTRLVVTPEDGLRKIAHISQFSQYERKILWEEEWEGIQHLRDPNLVVKRLEKLVEEYSAQDLGQHKAHQEFQYQYLKRLRDQSPQGKIKYLFLKRAMHGDIPLFYKRVCSVCAREVVPDNVVASSTRCTHCGGKSRRMRRFPRHA